ncbi:hypothetical protein ACQ4PT_061695 [Festuca glaucescens]
MLFILAMEPLQRLLEKATEEKILSPLRLRAARLRASFYADDAALFVNPVKADISAVQRILQLFGDVSGLRTSFEKCVAYPVACNGIGIDDIRIQGLLPLQIPRAPARHQEAEKNRNSATI